MADSERLIAIKKRLEEYIGRPLDYSGKLVELLSYLDSFNVLPKVNIETIPGAAGQYEFLKNQVTLNPYYNKGEDVAAHELTHALDNRMAWSSGLWSGNPGNPFSTSPTEEQKRFVEAYKKLNPSSSNLPNLPNDPYRGRGDEMRAWGVSEQVRRESPAAPHIDTTMASEFDVLMDLYKRALLSTTKK
jgi:hypothetical protein